jgi:hypothetical protein
VPADLCLGRETSSEIWPPAPIQASIWGGNLGQANLGKDVSMDANKVRTVMSPQTLRRRIRNLPARPRLTTELEHFLHGDRPRTVWYKSQKQHWLGWLRGYDGPGAYGRKDWHRSAEFVYNHICCPSMVLWLGDASGVPKATVANAKAAVLRQSAF